MRTLAVHRVVSASGVTTWSITTYADGRRIPTMATSMLPETDDDLARVDCRRCKAARE